MNESHGAFRALYTDPVTINGTPMSFGLALRAPRVPRQHRGSALGNLCHTGHPAEGVSLLVASRAGAAGKNGNTVGTYICSDLACSLAIRGLRPLTLPQGETLSVEARVARLEQRLGAFLGKALTS